MSEPLSIDDLFKKQQTAGGLFTIEPTDDETSVKITPWSEQGGCQCQFSSIIRREIIASIELTGQQYICCGKLLFVVRITFKDGSTLSAVELLELASTKDMNPRPLPPGDPRDDPHAIDADIRWTPSLNLNKGPGALFTGGSRSYGNFNPMNFAASHVHSDWSNMRGGMCPQGEMYIICGSNSGCVPFGTKCCDGLYTCPPGLRCCTYMGTRTCCDHMGNPV